MTEMEQAIIGHDLFSINAGDTSKGLPLLEQDLLEIGASSSIAQGIFYMLPLYIRGKLFVRFVSYNTLQVSCKICAQYNILKQNHMNYYASDIHKKKYFTGIYRLESTEVFSQLR